MRVIIPYALRIRGNFVILVKIMIDGVLVHIFISDNTTVSDVHVSLSSLIAQTGLSRMRVQVSFNNTSLLVLDDEVKRLREAGISIFTNGQFRFNLRLDAGDAISSTFLYRGISFLKNNSDGVVCPEIALRRVEKTDYITAVNYTGRVATQLSGALTDYEKINSKIPLNIRFTTVTDTCINLKPLPFSNSFLKLGEPHLSPSSALILGDYFVPKNLQLVKFTNNNFGLKRGLIRYIRTTSKSLCGRSKLLLRLRRRALNHLKTYRLSKNTASVYISSVMRSEIAELTKICFPLRGFEKMRFYNYTGLEKLQVEKLFFYYCTALRTLSSDCYDYIMVLPWLIHGGVDLFAVNYLNKIINLHPEKRILVILTDGAHESLSKNELGLDERIEVISLAKIMSDDENYDNDVVEVLCSILYNFHPSRLHIIASLAGYSTLIKYGLSLRSLGIKMLFSSYNYLIDEKGCCFGYSVEELPKVYRPGDTVTTDNLNSKQLWVKKYGFLDKDVLVHSQLFDNPPDYDIKKRNMHDGIRILWAAHVRPEKNPEIVPKIASRLSTKGVEFDCYGLFSPLSWENGKNPLECGQANVHYRGAYQGFFRDINLGLYDLFLYTSRSDGTPNVILEAGLAGLPIVTTSVGGIPAVVGNLARLVNNPDSVDEFCDSLLDVLNNYERAKLNALALRKQLIENHGDDNFTSQVIEMLERSKND